MGDPINLLAYLRDEVEVIEHPALGKVDLLSALDRAIERFSKDALEQAANRWKESEELIEREIRAASSN